MGALVVTPLILAWARPVRCADQARLVEAACCAVGLIVGTQLSFNSWFVYGVENYPLALSALPVPGLGGAAFRPARRHHRHLRGRRLVHL